MIHTDLLAKGAFCQDNFSEYTFQCFLTEKEVEPHYDSYEFLKIWPNFSLVALNNKILITNGLDTRLENDGEPHYVSLGKLKSFVIKIFKVNIKR